MLMNVKGIPFGDAIASVATPIARALNMDCIDPVTNQLRPESACAQRIDAINRFGDSVYDIFFQKKPDNKERPK